MALTCTLPPIELPARFITQYLFLVTFAVAVALEIAVAAPVALYVLGFDAVATEVLYYTLVLATLSQVCSPCYLIVGTKLMGMLRAIDSQAIYLALPPIHGAPSSNGQKDHNVVVSIASCSMRYSVCIHYFHHH
jgi:hypothetical protein